MYEIVLKYNFEIFEIFFILLEIWIFRLSNLRNIGVTETIGGEFWVGVGLINVDRLNFNDIGRIMVIFRIL